MRHKQLLLVAIIGAYVLGPITTRAEATNENNASKQRIGIYDSRVVAYAHFWTAEHQKQLKEKADVAKAAKSAGDAAQFNKLSKEISELQEKLHREVFSTAPAEEAMADLKHRLPEIQKQASVSVLVSKWDNQALESFKSAQQVDVTDLLVHEYKLEPKQMKTIGEIKKQKPVPLDKIDKMHED